MSIHRDEQNPKKWLVVFKGKKTRGFTTKTEAKAYESKLRLDDKKVDCSLYFVEVADDYLGMLEKSSTYATFSKCDHTIKYIVIPNFQNKRMDTITDNDCRKFYEYIQSLDYSTRHKNYIINKFSAVFKHARKYFNMQNNPARYLEPFKTTFDEKIKKRNKEMHIWTDDEFNKFIQCVYIDRYKLLFIVLYYTGLRIGEALALTWYDFDGESLHIYKSLTKKCKEGSFEIKDTKNVASNRVVRLNAAVASLLITAREHEATLSGFKDDWYIFNNALPLAHTSINRVKHKAIKESGVKYICLHDFRHSHASNLIANGCNIVAVSRRLGHSDINMTLKTYTHLLQQNDDYLLDYLEKSSLNLP